MFSSIEAALIAWAEQVPIGWFAFVAAFIEEVIAPVPSPLVMTVTGSIMQAQARGLVWFFLIALIAAVGKTIGSWIIYVVSDKAEDVVVGRFGKFFGIAKSDIEKIGTLFKGGVKDVFVIFLARAIPVIPTSAVSISCGVIKLGMKTYLLGTFSGTFVRNLFYLWLGFAGAQSAGTVLSGLDTIESMIQVVMVGVALSLIGYLYYKRNHGGDMLSWVKKLFR